jgi:hypothetical protein
MSEDIVNGTKERKYQKKTLPLSYNCHVKTPRNQAYLDAQGWDERFLFPLVQSLYDIERKGYVLLVFVNNVLCLYNILAKTGSVMLILFP